MILPKATISMAGVLPFIQALVRDWSDSKPPVERIKIREFFSGLAHYLQDSKGIIDTEYLASDEARSILEQTIETGIHENDPQKLEMLFLFLTNFLDHRFSSDKNKQQLLTILEKIHPMQAAILRDTVEWLTMAYGSDVVKQSTDYKPESSTQPYAGFIMEPIIVLFTRLSAETIAADLDALVEMNVFQLANNGNEIQHFNQTGRGFKPTTSGLQLLGYLRTF